MLRPVRRLTLRDLLKACLFTLGLITLLSTLHRFYDPSVFPKVSVQQLYTKLHPPPTQTSLALPLVYTTSETGSESCEKKYGLRYLEDTVSTKRPYCNTETSASQLSCFHANMTNTLNGRLDPFCLASKMVLSPGSAQLELDCELREWNEPDLEGIPKLENFREDWYETGPGHILRNYISIGDNHTAKVEECSPSSSPASHTILIKREGHLNLWHSLMEIFSYTLTMDILRLSSDESTGEPLFETIDEETSQVVILDEAPEGPYFELWNLLARQPVQRLASLSPGCLTNVIIPLPGASNPLWQGDWVPGDCKDSKTLSVFVDRILNLLSFTEVRDPSAPLTVTFIDRKGSRRLLNQESLLSTLRNTYSSENFTLNIVDFASITLREQISIVRNTDVLVGVHGAGLTHGMFLPPRSAVVEILPSELAHKGFRNLAKLRGHSYFREHAEKGGSEEEREKKDWQNENVVLEKTRFMELMDVAIKSMYHRGVLDPDVG
jgi:protein O-GlcNAc transferase